MTYDKDKERLNAERQNIAQRNAQREDTAALSGATLGILVALAIAVAAGAVFFLNNRNETAPTVPVIIPGTAPSPAAPEKETIIREEKIREMVPVPQATTQPNINITVPSAAPATPLPVATPSPSENTSPSNDTSSPPKSESSSPSPTN